MPKQSEYIDSIVNNKEIAGVGGYTLNNRFYNLYPNANIYISEVLDMNIDTGILYDTVIDVVNCTSVSAVLSIDSSQAGVLNFADFYRIGGSYENGGTNQEESLCYRSNLFNELLSMRDIYEKRKTIKCSPLYTDDIIISTGITVYRNDNLELIEPKKCVIITSPAPNAKEYMMVTQSQRVVLSESEVNANIHRALRKRCHRILEVACYYSIDTLVLGAFGCGVFGNNIDDLINIWHDLLSNDFYNKFKRVIFAVPSEDFYNKFKAEFITSA